MLLIIIIVICFVIFWCGNRKSARCYKNLYDPLDLVDFRTICGAHQMRIEKFFHNDIPSLYATERSSCTVNDWYDNIARTRGYISKLKFTKDTDSVIGKYITKWIDSVHHKFPRSLQKRMLDIEHCEFSIKITNGSWEFPNHFDATDNYLLIAAGTRKCVLDGKHHHSLTAGDMMYIPAGVYHKFWCDGKDDELNILVNINFINETNEIETKFRTAYPNQMRRLNSGIDYR